MHVTTLYHDLQKRLGDVVPPAELVLKAEVAEEVLRLKHERDAVILAHNYMEPALYHSVPDLRGDSLELCRRVAGLEAGVVVFCGVAFMAETAKLMNPERTVLLPSTEAGCSLAASIRAADVRALRRRFPGAPVVAYINTYAEVKAEADACCTSANAAAVVESFDAETVILVPDEFLARNVAFETGREIVFEPEDAAASNARRKLVGWRGRCEVHELFTLEDVVQVRRQFPDVVVLAHPECAPDVVAAADDSGSTSAMARRVREASSGRYLLLTECTMADNIAAENPDKELLRLCSHRCPHMGLITLEQTRDALRHMRHEVRVDPDIARRARAAVERMLEVP
jgi:quinolinate synthase